MIATKKTVILKTVAEVASWRADKVSKSEDLVFTPTMGNLHQGHIDLINYKSKPNCKRIVSIYINPTQFSANEDFGDYPRSINSDLEKLYDNAIDAVYLPTQAELYPNGLDKFTCVNVASLDNQLCSITRPHFFKGVATIVLKLLNIIKPTHLIMGQKDYQQFKIIERMLEEFYVPTRIKMIKTSREKDGLALSSRNHYLTEAERTTAPKLHKFLQEIKQEIISKKDKQAIPPQLIQSLCDHAAMALSEYGFKVEYLDIRDSKSLEKINNNLVGHENLVILIAAYLGTTRLIDNILMSN